MHDLPRVVTAGETMILGTPAQPGKLRHASNLELKIGGAESNVAIALARLGLSTGWVSNLGADELGQLVLNRIRGEGGRYFASLHGRRFAYVIVLTRETQPNDACLLLS